MSQPILVVDDKLIEQVKKFKYLSTEVTRYRNVYDKVHTQAIKAALVPSHFHDITSNDKYLTIAAEIINSKTHINPILTYTAKARTKTSKTYHVMRTTEMQTL